MHHMSCADAARFRRPSDALWRSEPWRAAADVVQFWAALPSLAVGHPGDGHGVLVIPGLMAGDHSTVGIRAVLSMRGYDAQPWGQGPNVGPTSRVVKGTFAALDRLCESTGRPVSVVGWSLGGFFARELARHRPDQVRQVVTMGTPIQLRTEDDPGASRVGWIYEALRPFHSAFFDGVPREEHLPDLSVPITRIYSRHDGIVPWRACLGADSPRSENVAVAASHTGMGFHPGTLRVLLDRLGQPAGTWRPYSPDRSTGGRHGAAMAGRAA